MKKLNALNLGKSLKREEMRTISGGLQNMPACSCGTLPPVLTHCLSCVDFCAHNCG